MRKSELDSWGLHNLENDPQAQRMVKREARRREIYRLKKEGNYTPKARKTRPEHFTDGSADGN